jgi:hypothetical protein
MNALKFDLFALAKPKCREDLLELVREMRAEMARINEHLDRAFEECPDPVDA